MDELLNTLAAATERLEHATRRENEASREKTQAINDLNAAQKAVDAKLAEMRKKAPQESDWADRGRQRGEVA